MNFLKSSKRPLNPPLPPHFRKIILQIKRLIQKDLVEETIFCVRRDIYQVWQETKMLTVNMCVLFKKIFGQEFRLEKVYLVRYLQAGVTRGKDADRTFAACLREPPSLAGPLILPRVLQGCTCICIRICIPIVFLFGFSSCWSHYLISDLNI